MEDLESGYKTVPRVSSCMQRLGGSLDTIIFPDGGLLPGELMEICGDSNTGKSLLLLELITHITLPVSCAGREREAVLIDCENTFDRSVLLDLMEKCIQNNAEPALARTLDSQHIARIKQEALQRLHLIQCYSQDSYEFNLHALADKFFVNNHRAEIEFVLVDSIATFYWATNTSKQLVRMETYLRSHCQTLQGIANKWQKIIVYTKPTCFGATTPEREDFEADASPSPEDTLTQSLATTQRLTGGSPVGNTLAVYRIELSVASLPSSAENDEEDDERGFNAYITTQENRQYVRFYLLNDFGFDWIEQQQ